MILIAGTGTPLAVALPSESTRTFLMLLWGGAALGVLRAMVWITAPKPLVAVLALALAWFSYPFMPALHAAMGTASVVCVPGRRRRLLAGRRGLRAQEARPLAAPSSATTRSSTPWCASGRSAHFIAVTRVVLGMVG